MENKTINKKRLIQLILVGIITISIVITLIVFMVISEDFDVWDYILYSLLIVYIVALTATVLGGKVKNILFGIPLRDEMQKKITHKAGFHGFIGSLIAAAAISIIAPFITELTVRMTIIIIMLFSGLIFLGSYIYFHRVGVPE